MLLQLCNEERFTGAACHIMGKKNLHVLKFSLLCIIQRTEAFLFFASSKLEVQLFTSSVDISPANIASFPLSTQTYSFELSIPHIFCLLAIFGGAAQIFENIYENTSCKKRSCCLRNCTLCYKMKITVQCNLEGAIFEWIGLPLMHGRKVQS